MSKKITIRINEIRAAMLFASNDESRYVLNGVHFKSKGDQSPPILVATDGRRLCVLETEAAQDEGLFPFEVTIPTPTLKAICDFAKQFGKVLCDQVTIEFHPSKRIIVGFAGGVCAVDYEKDAVIEGVYPAWKQVVPTGVNKEAISTLALNSEMLSDFAKVSKVLGCEPGIHCNLFSETGAFEVRISAKPNFYAVVCPMKANGEPKWQPEFLGLSETATVTEKAA